MDARLSTVAASGVTLFVDGMGVNHGRPRALVPERPVHRADAAAVFRQER